MQTVACVRPWAFAHAQPARRAESRRCRLAPARAAQQQARESSVEPIIEGLSSTYCDDFVCTSSPAVEASVRQLARDLQRCGARWAPIYASNVQYSDPFRKFKGPEGYAGLDFVPTNVQQPALAVTAMRMLDNATAEITWRLTGRLGVLPIDVAGTTTVSMNLLTGRIEQHREAWDLSACSPPAAAAWNAARALWAAKRASGDAQRAAGQALDSLTSVDDDGDQYVNPNPNDPGRFFQQKDTFKQDAALFVGVVVLFWTLVQGWTSLFSGSSGGGGAF